MQYFEHHIYTINCRVVVQALMKKNIIPIRGRGRRRWWTRGWPDSGYAWTAGRREVRRRPGCGGPSAWEPPDDDGGATAERRRAQGGGRAAAGAGRRPGGGGRRVVAGGRPSAWGRRWWRSGEDGWRRPSVSRWESERRRKEKKRLTVCIINVFAEYPRSSTRQRFF
jgi:hypothetical protein